MKNHFYLLIEVNQQRNFVLMQSNMLIVQEDYHVLLFYYEFHQDIPMFPEEINK
jgi:hypothetical protein